MKGKLIDAIFGAYVEEHLIQPTFIIDYPVSMSPLTKRHRNNPDLTERFELFVCGKELANAYSELNDPIDQLERFEEQAALKSHGDDEAMFIDYDFVRALEYGMPPTSGLGMGIDRLTMFMTGQTTIQDVLFFPQMRPEKRRLDGTRLITSRPESQDQGAARAAGEIRHRREKGFSSSKDAAELGTAWPAGFVPCASSSVPEISSGCDEGNALQRPARGVFEVSRAVYEEDRLPGRNGGIIAEIAMPEGTLEDLRSEIRSSSYWKASRNPATSAPYFAAPMPPEPTPSSSATP